MSTPENGPVAYEDMTVEARYRDLAESLPHIVFEIDRRGRITFANRDALRSLGYARNDLPKNLDVWQFIDSDDLGRARRDLRVVLAGHSTGAVEYTARRRDGSKFSILVFPKGFARRGRTVGVRGIAIDLTDQRGLLDIVRSSVAERTKAQEEERKRIARELHDGTAQSLAALSLQIDSIARGDEHLSQECMERLEQLRARTDSILEDVRRFCRELRPEALEQLGFVSALELAAAELNRESGICVRVGVRGSERRLAPDTELALFRIAQEALSNTRKHSQAKEVVIAVRFGRETVRLTVSDNGNGFHVPDLLAGFTDLGKLGLASMRERAHLHDGSFTVKSGIGHGTTVAVQMRA